jgi:hypothetical protein
VTGPRSARASSSCSTPKGTGSLDPGVRKQRRRELVDPELLCRELEGEAGELPDLFDAQRTRQRNPLRAERHGKAQLASRHAKRDGEILQRGSDAGDARDLELEIRLEVAQHGRQGGHGAGALLRGTPGPTDGRCEPLGGGPRGPGLHRGVAGRRRRLPLLRELERDGSHLDAAARARLRREVLEGEPARDLRIARSPLHVVDAVDASRRREPSRELDRAARQLHGEAQRPGLRTLDQPRHGSALDPGRDGKVPVAAREGELERIVPQQRPGELLEARLHRLAIRPVQLDLELRERELVDVQRPRCRAGSPGPGLVRWGRLLRAFGKRLRVDPCGDALDLRATHVEAPLDQRQQADLQLQPLDAEHVGATSEDVGELQVLDLEAGAEPEHQAERADANVAAQGVARAGLDRAPERAQRQRDPDEEEHEQPRQRRGEPESHAAAPASGSPSRRRGGVARSHAPIIRASPSAPIHPRRRAIPSRERSSAPRGALRQPDLARRPGRRDARPA